MQPIIWLCKFHILDMHNYTLLAYVPVLRFFSTKAAELKCQNFTVKKVCQVEHFKTFRI